MIRRLGRIPERSPRTRGFVPRAEGLGTIAGISECDCQVAADDVEEAEASQCSEVCGRGVSMVVVMLCIIKSDDTTICTHMTQISLQYSLMGDRPQLYAYGCLY